MRNMESGMEAFYPAINIMRLGSIVLDYVVNTGPLDMIAPVSERTLNQLSHDPRHYSGHQPTNNSLVNPGFPLN